MDIPPDVNVMVTDPATGRAKTVRILGSAEVYAPGHGKSKEATRLLTEAIGSVVRSKVSAGVLLDDVSRQLSGWVPELMHAADMTSHGMQVSVFDLHASVAAGGGA